MTQVDGTNTSQLVAEGIHVHFEGVRAVDGVDLTLEQGRIMGLIGPNGAGKTTFMNAVSHFVPLTAGRVRIDGADVTEAIRTAAVNRSVSAVAALAAVREELVERQRSWARERGGGVLEGRDIVKELGQGAGISRLE